MTNKIAILLSATALTLTACSSASDKGNESNTAAQPAVADASEYTAQEKRNMETIRGITGEVFSKGRTDLIPRYFDAEFVNHFAAPGMQDRDGFYKIVEGVTGQFDSFTVDAVDIFAKGDMVAMRDQTVAEHANGQHRHIDFHIFHMRDGKVLEHWNTFGVPSPKSLLDELLAGNTVEAPPAASTGRKPIVMEYTAREQRNIEAIYGITGEVFSKRRTDLIPRYFDAEFVNHFAPPGLKDRDGFYQIVDGVTAPFNRFTVNVVEIFAKGDIVAMRDETVGEHANGQHRHTDFHIFRMRDGKVLEHWNSFGVPTPRVQMEALLARK